MAGTCNDGDATKHKKKYGTEINHPMNSAPPDNLFVRLKDLIDVTGRARNANPAAIKKYFIFVGSFGLLRKNAGGGTLGRGIRPHWLNGFQSSKPSRQIRQSGPIFSSLTSWISCSSVTGP